MEKNKLWSSKYLFYIFFFGNFILFFMIYLHPNQIFSKDVATISQTILRQEDYLVFTSKCTIPNIDPWNEEVKPHYKQETYIPCNKNELLTYVVKNNTKATLYVNKTAIKYYSNKPIKCCYMTVTRNPKIEIPDDNITFSKCIDFGRVLDITDRIVTVKCRTKTTEVYSNTYAPININRSIQKKLNTQHFPSKIKPPSILVVGLDSISRLNFIRTLPKTRDFVVKNNWIEYTGYNKIGDNTFPNLMAILTGRNPSNANKICDPNTIGKLDKCNIIWKDYSNLGYVTAFAEDEFSLNTFNYKKKGFIEDPTDYYFRPYTFAINKLSKMNIDGMDYCTGPETSGERILNLAKDFSNTFKNYPSFGFFWMNSFSHNDLNSPTRMDNKLLNFFEDLLKADIFKNTIIIFLSDHGMRFGKIRVTRTGWLEERLPFLYLWLPLSFRQKYSQEYEYLSANANNVLTTPYDLHITLQHILKLSGFNYTITPSIGCSLCKSFLQGISPRSCEEVGIDVHWCTCYGYRPMDVKANLVVKTAYFIVDQLNKRISSYKNESKECAIYKLSRILSANVPSHSTSFEGMHLLIILETEPEALFESTISVINGNFKNESYISRLDLYSSKSECVENPSLKLYCYCK